MAAPIVSEAARFIINQAQSDMDAKRQAEARRDVYELNEMAASAADRRTRALYNDFYSPNAQLRQLREAGLSPSLAFADGISTQGMQGAQGAGAGNFAPHTFQTDIDIAEKENIQADTRKKNAEASAILGENERGLAEIAKLWAQAGNEKASTALLQVQTTSQEIDNFIKNSTAEFEIEKAENLANKLLHEAEMYKYEASSSKVKAEIDNDTKEVMKQQRRNEAQKQIKEIAQLAAKTKLTEQQEDQVWNEIQIAWSELEVHQEQASAASEQARAATKNAATQRIEMWQKVQQFEKTLELKNKEFKWGIASDALQVIGKIAAAFLLVM